ncbi:MAG TPA: threonine--tRNA ligase [Candidatus Pacearchaeota archaeon]|nr:threonine--tRNA ligase [Candidatus Pacearchaeota archaeon]
MKILSLHCDYIKFKPLKKALRQPEELSERRQGEIVVDNPLVLMIAVEKQDESNPDLIKRLIKEVKELAKQVKVDKLVLYPYAHLSPSLSKPDFALKTLEEAEKKLKKDFKIIERAPFGYYKEFELKVKGHPLSELSRDIHFSGEMGVEEDYDSGKLLREISKSKLDSRELKDNDHRILGQQMNLFSFSEVAPGMVFWHNNGNILKNKLFDFWREEHQKACYEEITTPQILDNKLWKISGHWDKYKDNMFTTDYEGREFAVKPMNCPGAMMVYRSSPKSYKDLPLRYGELGIVHRQELSGVLSGLFRLIQFTQDDAHIFCTEKQLESEIICIMQMIDKFYKIFGFKYSVELSTRPEKRIGDEKVWDNAEKVLEKTLKKMKTKFKINKGDGAFYGPKIDFHIKDSLNRSWQLATIQLDFAMPERFDLTYKDNKDKNKRPIILHRVIYGAIERFIGILLEHTNGHLPLWLAPKQVRVINFTNRNDKACKALDIELSKKGIRADLDLGSEPLSGKIKKAEMEKIPLIVVIGDKEEKSGDLAVRRNGKITNINKDEFIEMVEKEVDKRE